MTPTREPSRERVFVGVGASLGDRLAQTGFAAEALAALPGLRLLAGSRLYDTAPWGGVAIRRFLNGALMLEAGPNWGPESLLEALLEIEVRAGRTRNIRWEDRVLDLDLLLWGERTACSPGLTLPHPRLHERSFVLRPLCDLAPELRHPAIGHSLRELLAGLRAAPGDCVALAPEVHPAAWPAPPLPAPTRNER
ncbi:MAG: 2-amino-4-hydroxy-6-hydroxymethyldihydropteridine diphosphokinase [Polyangia bacterium]|jgi:2-amino-4-hydroxy-6-hydroxymethyldihydropteridine diphosphokinase|nr:2-amino-4-hydroxy-6-hydroxymethyldihydropteridine diphosphokinase [Polyangia bacterium]